MPINFQEADARRNQRRPRPVVLTGSSPDPQSAAPVTLGGRALDLAAAPFRGVEGAVQDAYGLADTVLFDQLPDWDERILGESRTGLGGFVEGMFNFGAGMVGASFIPLGWTAKLGRLAPFVRGAVKGAFADFAVFDGHEERLSNLLQSFPVLQNPVSEFLAADPEDSQIEGRFKNAVEGLGLGTLTELAFLSFKALRAGRIVRGKGGTPEAVEKAMDKAAPHEKLESAARAAAGQTPPPAAAIGSPALPQAAEGALRGVGLGQPNEAVREAVEAFAALKGITREYPDATKIQVDEKRAKAIADAFELAKHDPSDPKVQASYQALAKDVQEQYDFITRKHGLTVEAWTGSGEPYKSSADMAADIKNNKHLWFLPTSSAFGEGAEGATHPMLADSGFKLGDRPLKINDIFRVVHDFFGHAAEGNQFGPRGEEIAWTLHAHLFSDAALPALTAETRGQNSWVNYGKHLRRADGSIPVKGDPDFVPAGKRAFAEQKAALLPDEFNAPEGRPRPKTVPGTPEHSAALLRTMGFSEEDARAFYDEVGRREAPFSHATLLQRDPLDPRVNPRKLSPAQLLEQGMTKRDLNLSSYQGPDGPLNLMRAMEQLVPLGGAGDKGVRTLDAARTEGLRQLSDLVNERNPQKLLIAMQGEVGNLQGLDARLQAYRMGLQAQAGYAYKLAQKALSASGSERDMVAWRQSLENLGEMHDLVKGIGREVSRGLGSNRSPVKYLDHLFDDNAVRQTLHELGGKGRMDDLAKKFKLLFESSSNPLDAAARAGALAQATRGRRAFGILNEYWYNALLGRPTTLAVNALSNAITTVYRPLESIAGGLLSGDNVVIQDAVREISSLVHSAGDAWQATAAAMKGGGLVLDPRTLLSDINDPARKAISTAGTKIDPDSIQGQSLDWLGRLVRMPSAALTATDQFFQQLNYRAVARSELMKQGMALKVAPQNLGAFVSSEMDRLVFQGQAYGTAQLYNRGVEEAIQTGIKSKGAADEYAREYVRKALESPDHARLSALNNLAQARAQEATFTAPLEPGTISYRVQEAVLNHWYLRLVMPFVRTPVNVIKFAHDRTSGAILGASEAFLARRFPGQFGALANSHNRFVQDILSGNPRKVADAKGRLFLGMSTLAYVVTKAAEVGEDGMPLITGRGPVDKEQRRLLEEAGWQSYSIRIGDKYVSYGRLDPFASIIGLAADVVNFSKYSTAEDQNTAEDLMYGTVSALANNLTNKTYLAGLANAVDMLHDPLNRAPVWFRTLGASFVPGQAAAAVAVVDPVLRDVQSMMEAASARIPGLSSTLPPLRNLLGEPVTRPQALGSGAASILNAFVPVMYREVSDDLVNKELANLKHGFTPPRRTRGTLELTSLVNRQGQNAYDRWLELHGEVELGGKTLRQQLRRTITSKAYQSMSDQGTEGVESPRVGIIQGVLDDYRAAAYRKLLREFPELAADDRRRFELKQSRTRGNDLPPLAQSLR